MRSILDAKSIIGAVIGLVIGATSVTTAVLTKPEYILDYAMDKLHVVEQITEWYCQQDANVRLRYRENLYKITQPNKLTMDCFIEAPK